MSRNVLRICTLVYSRISPPLYSFRAGNRTGDLARIHFQVPLVQGTLPASAQWRTGSSEATGHRYLRSQSSPFLPRTRDNNGTMRKTRLGGGGGWKRVKKEYRINLTRVDLERKAPQFSPQSVSFHLNAVRACLPWRARPKRCRSSPSIDLWRTTTAMGPHRFVAGVISKLDPALQGREAIGASAGGESSRAGAVARRCRRVRVRPSIVRLADVSQCQVSICMPPFQCWSYRGIVLRCREQLSGFRSTQTCAIDHPINRPVMEEIFVAAVRRSGACVWNRARATFLYARLFIYLFQRLYAFCTLVVCPPASLSPIMVGATLRTSNMCLPVVASRTSHQTGWQLF